MNYQHLKGQEHRMQPSIHRNSNDSLDSPKPKQRERLLFLFPDRPNCFVLYYI